MRLELFANQVVDSCSSTNDLVRQLGDAGYPHGTWVSARVQESGRGRLGRKWESFEGNLFLSLLLRIEEKSRWSWVPLATAVGVVDALLDWNSSLDIRIKWPNDLWVFSQDHAVIGAKLGGILCEAVGNRESSYIIVGLGLNCLHAPEGLDQRTISLTQALGGVAVRADEIRERVILGLLKNYQALSEPHGLESLVSRYQSRSALKVGTEVEWVHARSGTSELRTAQVLGLGKSGELLVKASDGESLSLYAEDVKIRPRSGLF